MKSLLNDLSILTTIPLPSLERLSKLTESCICDEVDSGMNMDKQQVVELNLGIGELIIANIDNQLKYKFIPSKSLETNLKETITSGKNPLIKALETSLADKFEFTYKDII